jgi:hypothetical protein
VSKYKKGEDVPTHVIINRLNSLSDDVTKGITKNFGMSIPARLDYDADLVLSIAARRLASIEELEKELDSANLTIAKFANDILDLDNLDQDSHQFVHCWDDVKKFALLTLGRCDS